MHSRAYYIINALTLYRLVAAPVLVVLACTGQYDLFKWMLVLSFATDAVDGTLARKYKVSRPRGAQLDSIADDATFMAAITGLVLMRPDFLQNQMVIVMILLALLLVEVILALIKYGKMSGFHTWLAKAATLLQGLFFIGSLFFERPVDWLFYVTAGVTGLQLIEEIILVLLVPAWQADIKGIYWWMRKH